MHTHTHTHTHTKALVKHNSGSVLICSAHSAVARCRHGGKALKIDYSGVISLANFRQLDRLTLASRLTRRVALESLANAVTLPGAVQVDRQGWPAGVPPSVVIVRDDQFDLSQQFCYQLGLLGIIRVSFRVEQTAMALALVARMAR